MTSACLGALTWLNRQTLPSSSFRVLFPTWLFFFFPPPFFPSVFFFFFFFSPLIELSAWRAATKAGGVYSAKHDISIKPIVIGIKLARSAP